MRSLQSRIGLCYWPRTTTMTTSPTSAPLHIGEDPTCFFPSSTSQIHIEISENFKCIENSKFSENFEFSENFKFKFRENKINEILNFREIYTGTSLSTNKCWEVLVFYSIILTKFCSLQELE